MKKLLFMKTLFYKFITLIALSAVIPGYAMDTAENSIESTDVAASDTAIRRSGRKRKRTTKKTLTNSTITKPSSKKSKIFQGTKTFQCVYPGCTEKFAQKAHLTDHQKNHDPANQFPCTNCLERFKTERSLIAHNKKHLSYNKKSRELISCSTCLNTCLLSKSKKNPLRNQVLFYQREKCKIPRFQFHAAANQFERCAYCSWLLVKDDKTGQHSKHIKKHHPDKTTSLASPVPSPSILEPAPSTHDAIFSASTIEAEPETNFSFASSDENIDDDELLKPTSIPANREEDDDESIPFPLSLPTPDSMTLSMPRDDEDDEEISL